MAMIYPLRLTQGIPRFVPRPVGALVVKEESE